MSEVMLKKVRLSFPELFEAKTVNGEGKPAFSASFILPPNHPAIKELKAAMVAVANEKWGAKAPAILKAAEAGDKVCLHNGDLKAYDGYAGNMFVSARKQTRPLVMARDMSPLTAQDGKIYSGCYVNAKVSLWAQDNNYGKRINASLEAVQFLEDGDAFAAGGPPNAEGFDNLDEGADAGDLA